MFRTLISSPSALLLAGAVGCASVFLTLKHVGAFRENPNVSSRLATIESIADRGTFRIDESTYTQRTIDKVWLNGHYYSTKPFLLSALGGLAYRYYARHTGITLAIDPDRATMFLTCLISVLPHALLLLYFGLFLKRWVRSGLAFVLSFSCLALGSISIGYATAINNHLISAATFFIAFYYAYIIRTERSLVLYWILSGFLAGLVTTFDHPMLFFGLSLFCYLFAADRKKALTYFLPAAMIPIIVHFELNYLATGSIIPLEIRHDLFRYPDSYWLDPQGNDALNEPKLIYLYNLTFGHHGFFAMTPVFLLGVAGLISELRRKQVHAWEACAIGAPLLIWFFFFVAYTHHYGGQCFGVRWFIPAMPLLFLFAARWLDSRPGVVRLVVFVVFFGVGVWHAMDSLNSPWNTSRWEEYCRLKIYK